MRSTRTILLILAGVWTTLLIIEKIFSATGSIKIRSLPLPRRIIHHSIRVFKSALLFSLVIANVFMAIALIEDKK